MYILVFNQNMLFLYSFFFFQAEDGIRDLTVTGVQKCALPISVAHVGTAAIGIPISLGVSALAMGRQWRAGWRAIVAASWPFLVALAALGVYGLLVLRSEERRVGKECRCGWSAGE